MSYLVAVSAPVGGGKTSLVEGLHERLPDAAAIHFDSYEALSKRPLEEMQGWLERGAPIDELAVPGLAEALARLREGHAVTDPSSGRLVPPAKYLLFETPFARAHTATGADIDLAIWIDTPLDVALARNLLEFTRRPQMYGGELAPWLQDYLRAYLGTVRAMLLVQQERVGGAADLVLDGTRELEANLAAAAHAISERLP